jgi:AraC-like DNA-binding protein
MTHWTPPVPEEAHEPGLANPFQAHLRLIQSCRQSSLLLQSVLPIHQLTDPSQGSSWRHQGFNPCIGSLVANASILPPMQLEVDAASRADLTAILLYGGSIQLDQSGEQLACGPGGLVLLAAQPWRCQSDSCSLVMLTLERRRLLRVALTMAEERQLPLSWREQLQPSRPWQAEGTAPGVALESGLRQVLSLANELLNQGEALLTGLELDLLIYRLLAALLIPDLAHTDPLERLRSRRHTGADRFDELIAYIHDHLHESLSLQRLEEVSHYSRRSLQYAFQGRVGCSPTQWIRAMRLERARRYLQQPQPNTSVSSIAKACGYNSVNLFTIDFQQRFHLKPSELLREFQWKPHKPEAAAAIGADNAGAQDDDNSAAPLSGV